MRDIVVSLELGKARSELDYLKLNGNLEPLPEYVFETEFEGPEGFAKLMWILEKYKDVKLLSNDIETIYPKRGKIHKSEFMGKTPGLPVLCGFAANSTSAITFELFESRSKKLSIVESYRLHIA